LVTARTDREDNFHTAVPWRLTIPRQAPVVAITIEAKADWPFLMAPPKATVNIAQSKKKLFLDNFKTHHLLKKRYGT
jgi:hypothetical protein